MLDKIYSSVESVKSLLFALKDTDLGQVSFGSVGLALGAGLFLLTVFLYKVLWGRNKFRHYYSGHEIPAEFNRSTLFRRLACFFPKLLLAGSSVFLLFALANPYLPRTKIETIVESLEIVYLSDVSTSKGWPFENTGKSVGEITRQAHINFLKMRRGQNDRVALFLFSKNAYMAQRFIMDDDVYIMAVEDAPYVITDSHNGCLSENDPNDQHLDLIAPRDMVKIIEGEGSTNLIAGLRAAIGYFDQKGRKNIKRKVLIVETDTAVDEDPKSEFLELKKRGIVLYGIFIKPHLMGESRGCGGDLKRNPVAMSKLLQEKVKAYGGLVFDVQDKRSLDRAYAEINKLETAPVKIIRHLFKVLIFQRPLAVAVALAIAGLLLGVFNELLFGEYP